METAKVWSGRSQAVRLPRAFRVDAGEVRIRRRGRAIVLEPVPESWEWLDALAGDVDEDFVSAVRDQPEESGLGWARCFADAVSPGRERHHYPAERHCVAIARRVSSPRAA